MKVVYHGAAGPQQRARFAEVETLHGIEIVVVDPATDSIEPHLADMSVWWHVLTPITADHLAAAPKLRLVHKWGVGVNTIDLDAAAARGVAVANMPGSNAAAVAEHAVLLMLSVLRRLPTIHAATSCGAGWGIDAGVSELAGELSGRRVGLIGHGDIAQRVERLLGGFGCEIRHHRRSLDRPGAMELDDLLAWSDIVSLHVPLSDETTNLINADRLGLMQPHAVLINTARGGLVDLDALTDALMHDRLGGVGLDTFDIEPWAGSPSLAALPNVVVTPHIAWLTADTLERSLALALANVDALSSGTLNNRVV